MSRKEGAGRIAACCIIDSSMDEIERKLSPRFASVCLQARIPSSSSPASIQTNHQIQARPVMRVLALAVCLLALASCVSARDLLDKKKKEDGKQKEDEKKPGQDEAAGYCCPVIAPHRSIPMHAWIHSCSYQPFR